MHTGNPIRRTRLSRSGKFDWLGKSVIVRAFLVFVVISVVIFFLSDSIHKVAPSPPNPVLKVDFGDVTKIIDSSGQVVNPDNVYWSPPSIQPVSQILVKVGQRVHRGMILASLNNQLETAAYENAKVALDADQVVLTNAENALVNQRNNQLAQLAAANQTLANAQENLQNNLPIYLSPVDQALNNLSTFQVQFEEKEITYDSTLQNSLNNYLNAKRIASGWTNLVGDSQTVIAIMQSIDPISGGACGRFGLTGTACTPNALAGDFKDYSTAINDYYNALSNYNSAKQTRDVNRQNDLQQLKNLEISYNNALNQQKVNLAKDKQVVANALAQVNIINVQLNAIPNLILRSKVTADKYTITSTFRKLSDTIVKSPINGTVIAINNVVGQSPTPIVYSSTGAGTGMFVIRGDSQDQFKANFNQIDGQKIKLGQTMSMEITMTMPQSNAVGGVPSASSLLSGLTGSAGTSATGTGGVTDSKSASVGTNRYTGIVTKIVKIPSGFGLVPGYSVYLSFQDNPSDIFPGLPGKVRAAVTAISHVLVVPNSAIKQIGGYSYVQRVIFKSGKYQSLVTKVTLGVVGTNSTEITSGINIGEMINVTYQK
jgi:multidrug efflux pump subunit AcrA (membrane-fusion protein)